MMDRREFVYAITTCFLAAPFVSRAAQAGRVYHLGILRATAPSPEIDAQIPLAMRELGYVEGENLIVEYRHAAGKMEDLPVLARELVHLRVDVICTVGLSATRAAKEATKSIPIVMFTDGDPVALGLVSSLARPDGNLTGVLLSAASTLTGKRMELLKEAIPLAARIGFLAPEDHAYREQEQVQAAQKAASSLGTELVLVEVHDGNYDSAFAALMTKRAEAVCVAGSTFFARDGAQIIALASKHRLPAIYESPEYAKAGGLIAYGASIYMLQRRRATYIDRIFKGAKPGELAIEQPTTFELAINLKTAKTLGITIPRSLLLRADQLIE